MNALILAVLLFAVFMALASVTIHFWIPYYTESSFIILKLNQVFLMLLLNIIITYYAVFLWLNRRQWAWVDSLRLTLNWSSQWERFQLVMPRTTSSSSVFFSAVFAAFAIAVRIFPTTKFIDRSMSDFTNLFFNLYYF